MQRLYRPLGDKLIANNFSFALFLSSTMESFAEKFKGRARFVQ
jgi:hypothetical protein